MWNFGLLSILPFIIAFVNGQEQFLREVKNPSGPSQIILRGGFLGDSAVPNDVQVVQEQPEQQQQIEFANPPQQQTLPLQATLDSQPIPDGGADNPFTNGNDGFGLRLSQQAPAQPQQPVQQQAPVVTQQQQQQQIEQQAGPLLQQTPLNLPQLPPGQQYVDLYGRPILFTEPQVLNQQQPTAPAPQQPQVVQPAPVQKQAFVDQYGRQLGEIEVQQPIVPVAYNVAQPIQQFVQNVVQPAAVEIPILHNAPPPLTLHTYAVPAVRKVGNLVIPYAQKITVAKTANEGVVFPPTVQAPALVKSKHRTVFSPVKVVAPVATEAHAVINEVHTPVQVVHQQIQTELHAHQPVLIQEQQQVLVEQPHVAVAHHQPQQLVQVQHHQPQQLIQVQHQPQQLVQVQHHQPVAVAHPQVAIEHPPQQLVQVAHPHVQVLHHVQQPLLQTVAHAPAAVIQQQHHFVQVGQPHVVAAAPPPQVLVKKIKQVPLVEKHIIPDFTLIHQPVLPKVLFQKHIFNVKHGSQPLIYQDLCTVYPFQKNLRACVLKKAVLPELHHPDIRTVHVEEQTQQVQQTDQTIIAGGSSLVLPQPQVPTTPQVTVTKDLPQNIQETIKRESESAKSKAEATTETAATTAQPETAETRESSSSGKSSRRRRKNSSKKDDGFKLV